MYLVTADAPLALLSIYGEDTFTLARQVGIGAALANPKPDVRLAPAWRVCAVLTASDAVFPERGDKAPLKAASRTVFYAWVLEDANAPGHFVIAIRGTIGMPEWIEDLMFCPRKHPVAGQVEDGFYTIYESMGIGSSHEPVADELAKLLKGALSVTVTGHSLGAALGHFLAFDLADPARLGMCVQSIQFASPRPGNATFGEALKARISGHRAYAYELDLVPRVPFGFGFSPVPGTIEIPALHPRVHVDLSVTCSHHALSYATLIDPASFGRFIPINADQPFLSCVSVIS